MMCYRDMKFCRFYKDCADGTTCHTEQVIDRIVIQVRGGYGVTIHTADAGLK